MGNSILSALNEFNVRGWFTKAIPALRDKIVSAEQQKSEVDGGGIVTVGGGLTTTALAVSTTDLGSHLLGRIMAAVTGLSNQDLLVTALAVGQPLMQDGTTGVGIVTMAGGEEARVTLIATNSDGAGASDEADNGTPLLVAVLAGTTEATAKAATAFLTSAQISDALAASTGVHDGVTAWAHVAQIVYEGTGPAITVTMNRNNVISSS